MIMHLIYVLITVIILINNVQCDDYNDKRAKILELESKLSLGGKTTLTDKETIVNNCLMKHKLKEVEYGFQHPEDYNFSQHFFKYKDKIPSSKVYQIIKTMPKGALLHSHQTGMLGPDYMMNITYQDHLYVCFGKVILFRFSNIIPNITCDVTWQLMSDIRSRTPNITKFDLEIRKHFTIAVKNPDVTFPSIKESWAALRKYFSTIFKLLAYKPIYEQYIYDILKSFKEDKIMYVELRAGALELHELNGTMHDVIFTTKLYKKIIDKFVKDNPDFFGMKLIFTGSKKSDIETVNSTIQMLRNINKEVPRIYVGYDLVGQEDTGNPIKYFVPLLETVKDLNFFFHAGETDWSGTFSDENLIDAVLLGAKRIGHGYALTKHPVVMKQVIDNDIGIEVNVVSNGVLSLVRDVRNHPLSVFLSLGLPVVLSSDDPGAWEADALSDDFYVAFVGVSSKHADLRMLKTLALNSIKYSALDDQDKQKATRVFQSQWNRFIDNFNCSLF